MLFNSPAFYLFFAFILSLRYFSPLSWRGKKLLLLLFSYVFYSAWNPPFVLLLLLSTLVDWTAARKIARAPRDQKTKRRLYLILSLLVNLGLLAFFKYGSFLLENFTLLVSALGWQFKPAPMSIILPVGISFYTFQSLSYTLDVYRERIRPSSSFLDFSLYVSFFPQLVAGPIVRSEEFLPQCREEKTFDSQAFGWGLFLLTMGLFQKTVLADLALAPVAENVFSGLVASNFLNNWTGIFAFSAQIYFDFSGYTNCALGTALCLGFRLPLNFRFPYAALGFSDFWRRWHISLSTWLRDYLYIPLGGNRVGALGAAGNVMITMLLGGLWHGASWNFVLWGGLHGMYLVLERAWKRFVSPVFSFPRSLSFLGAFLTFLVVSLTWVFFRSPDFSTALNILGGLFNFNPFGKNLQKNYIYLTFIITAVMLVRQWRLRDSVLEDVFTRRSPAVLFTLWLFMILAILMIRGGGGNAFIYFQF